MIVLHNARVFTGITVLLNSAVLIEGNFIVDVISQDRLHKRSFNSDTRFYNLEGLNIAPGFIDTHIHGIHGYGTEDGSLESFLEMSKALTKYGVTGFLPTLYPQEQLDFLHAIRQGRKAQGQEKGARILGLHLEGPYLSPEKRGVQKAEHFQGVNLEQANQIIQAGEESISLMTVAPELKNMRELALFCNQHGILLSAGHTDATYEQMVEGFQAGILHATHMYNAMRNLHHRNPGAVGALLLHKTVSAELIADGYHVHPALIELLVRTKPVDKIILVTDALKPTQQSQGRLMANDEEVYLDELGIFRRKIDDVIAGSSLTMNRGVRNLVNFGIPLEQALKMASSNPADLLSLKKKRGYLLPGSFGDIVVFDNELNVKLTFVEGSLVYEGAGNFIK